MYFFMLMHVHVPPHSEAKQTESPGFEGRQSGWE